MKTCLDAGHGKGYNPSPCGYGYTEGTRMFEFQRYLEAALEQYEGVEVVCTRGKVTDDLSLFSRAQAGAGCDLLLSLHSNAAGSGVAEGTDYVAVFASVHATAAQLELAKELSEAVAECMGTEQTPQVHQWWNSTKTADYMGVIRHAHTLGVPAMLIEHSFHTDPSVTKWLMDDVNLKALAETEAAVIARHYNLKKEDGEMRYKYLKDIPKNYREETIDRLVAQGIIAGKGGEGEDLIVDLGEDAVRVLIYLDRENLFGSGE